MPLGDRIRELDEEVAQAVRRAVEDLREEVRRRLDEATVELQRRLGEVAPELPDSFVSEEHLRRLAEEAAAPAAEALDRARDEGREEGRELGRGEGGQEGERRGRAEAYDEQRAALAEIDRAATQGEVLDALLAAAGRHASRAALLLVREGRLAGWGARGFEAAPEAARAVSLPADGEPWSALVAGGAPAAVTGARCAPLVSQLDSPLPREGYAVPMLLRDRVAAVLYADRPREEDRVDLPALQVLTYAAALALETLAFRQRPGTSTLEPAAGLAPAEPAWEAEPAAALEPEEPAFAPPELEELPAEAPAEVEGEVAGFEEGGWEIEEPAETAAPEEAPAPAGEELLEEVEAFEPGVTEAELELESEIELEGEIEPEGEELTAAGPGIELEETAFDGAPALEAEPAQEEAPAVEEEPAREEAPAGAPEAATEPIGAQPTARIPWRTEPAAPEEPAAGEGASPAASPRPPAGGEVAPPDDVEGPGWAFSAARGGLAKDEEAVHEEARRLARLLVSEIQLYNQDEVEEGRRNRDLYERLKDEIERSRQIYEERVEAEVRERTDYFYQELVRQLGAGDAKALGI